MIHNTRRRMKAVTLATAILSLAAAASNGAASIEGRPMAATHPRVVHAPSPEDLWRDEVSTRAKPVLSLGESPGFVQGPYYLGLTPLLVVYPNGLALLQSRSDTGWGFSMTVFTPAVMRRISGRLAALGVGHRTTGNRAFGSSGVVDGPRVWIELTLRGRTQSVSVERITGPLPVRGRFGIDPRQAARRRRLFALFGELQRPMAAFGTSRPRFRPADTVALIAVSSVGFPFAPIATWPRGISAPDPSSHSACITLTQADLVPVQAAAPKWPAPTIWRLPHGHSSYVIGKPSYPHERSCADAFKL